MIIFVLILVVLAIVMGRVSLRFALHKVVYSATTEKVLVECEEEFSFITTLSNNKLMPVTYIKLAELVPAQMEIVGEETSLFRENGVARLTSSTYLLPYQKYTKVHRATLAQRGRYFLRGAILYGGDVWGFSETVEYVNQAEEIVVLPKRLSSGELNTVVGGFIGDISVRRFIMEDPILTLGFREYTGREPMRDINWVQSLKNNALMVKNYDHTQDLSVTVVLNVECGPTGKELNSKLIETCFSVARGVCETLEQKKIKYSFVTNGAAAGALGHWSAISEGLGHRHLYTILEGLGRATYDSTENFAKLLGKIAVKAESGRAHIIITPTVEGYWAQAYRQLGAATGGHCTLLRVDTLLEDTQQEVA